MPRKYKIQKQYATWVVAAALTPVALVTVTQVILGANWRVVLLSGGIGLVVAGIFVATAGLVSRPIRWALEELNDFVERMARGEARGETFSSGLKEVDQAAVTLTEMMRRIEKNQTKLATAEQELKLAQKDLDEYTYTISHDLKEPLRGIEGFSKLLVDGYRDKLDDNGRHYVETIRNSTLRMQQLIIDLLKFSRLSHQKQPMVPVGLNLMLIHVRLNLQYALDQKHAELHVNRLPTIICDATAITEVFHNLISNAIKYNDKLAPVVEIGYAEKPHPKTGESEYEFYIRDNGVGIKPENFDKIFQLFQRLGTDNEGTGVGLTLVRRIVEWHGGRIWLESAEGKGTTFYFTLPKRETKMPATAAERKLVETTTTGASIS